MKGKTYSDIPRNIQTQGMLSCYFRGFAEKYTKYGHIPGEAALPEKLGEGVRYFLQNTYPIYYQNVRFLLPYLWPDQKCDTLL